MAGFMSQQKLRETADNNHSLVGNIHPPTKLKWRCIGGLPIIYLTLMSMEMSKISNMPNNVGWPMNNLFIFISCRQNLLVSKTSR